MTPQRKTTTLLAALLIAAIILRLCVHYGPKFSGTMRRFQNARNVRSATTATEPSGTQEIIPPPPIDLTAGDFGDISQIRRDHPILRQGRACEISPQQNDTRMTGQRIAFEFSNIEERLKRLEQMK